MEFRASHRYARMAVRKARRVIDQVRGKTVNQALDTLDNDRHRAARSIAKVLRSAVANALQNPGVRPNRLVVSEAYCNEGPVLQKRMRFRPSSMGRALPFRRRTCHIHIKIQDPELRDAASPVEPVESATTPETNDS
ncbi:MAG: 50S ribosomal protein L22 [Planctomycetes bacterium]|nr:50S ribosomal protein L22 [Planctomycetota bacterium]MCB9871678.1 50S ribosomal protein L22 [Planctomycetota bacterium]